MSHYDGTPHDGSHRYGVTDLVFWDIRPPLLVTTLLGWLHRLLVATTDDRESAMGMRESASARMAASPEPVFSLVTDPSRLPSWNRAIADVVEVPEHLESGSVWKVRLHALGQSWVSKSRVSTLDPVTVERLVF